jgi:hypothetical protein
VQERIEAEVADVAALQGGDIGAPVRVCSPEVGGEEPVVGQERWEEMHRLKAAGMTVSGVARATGLDRKTVRRCLRQVRWQAYRRPARREALLAPGKPRYQLTCFGGSRFCFRNVGNQELRSGKPSASKREASIDGDSAAEGSLRAGLR